MAGPTLRNMYTVHLKLIGYSKYKDDLNAGCIMVDSNLGGVSGHNGGWLWSKHIPWHFQRINKII